MKISNKEYKHLRGAVPFPKNFDWDDTQSEIEQYPYITWQLKILSMVFVLLCMLPFGFAIFMTVILSDHENFGDMAFGLLLFYAFTFGCGVNLYSFLRKIVERYVYRRELFKFMIKHNLIFEFKSNVLGKKHQKRYENEMKAIQKGNNILNKLFN